MTGSSRQTEAGVASGVTTVPADNRAGKPRSSAALLFLAIVIAAVVIDLALYRRSQPDLGSGAVDQPSWALVAALASVSVLGLGVLAWRPARKPTLVAPFAVAMLVVTNLAIWPAIWFVEGVPVPAYLLRAPPAAATRQAWRALDEATAAGTCATVTNDPTGLLPTPYQRCAYRGYGGPPEVEYLVGLRSQYGFIFAPRAPAAGGSCVRRVSGNWWAEVNTHTVGPSWLQWDLGDGVVCPSSFRSMPI